MDKPLGGGKMEYYRIKARKFNHITVGHYLQILTFLI